MSKRVYGTVRGNERYSGGMTFDSTCRMQSRKRRQRKSHGNPSHGQARGHYHASKQHASPRQKCEGRSHMRKPDATARRSVGTVLSVAVASTKTVTPCCTRCAVQVIEYGRFLCFLALAGMGEEHLVVV